MKVTIEGFGEMTAGNIQIDRQLRWHPPGPRFNSDWSVWYDEKGGAEVTGPDVVKIEGEWHGPDLPLGELLTVTCEGNVFRCNVFRCVVTDKDGAKVRLRGERADGRTEARP